MNVDENDAGHSPAAYTEHEQSNHSMDSWAMLQDRLFAPFLGCNIYHELTHSHVMETK